MSGISTNLAKEVGYHLVSAQHKVVPLIRREDGGFITPQENIIYHSYWSYKPTTFAIYS